ncbi:Phosphatidate cytidylyltransferase [hydrothermal vent metagenome]|uniref:Phosphatidate cytidylyltransferase n=1 Tax=hydrothermal vent metagenome TaxID=652676 RepID=A0A1W1EIF6_9ZZZZ
MKIFTDHSERWLTGIALLLLVGFIGWIDNFLTMWLFLGVVYMLAFYEAMQLFRLYAPSLYFWALSLWIIAYFYPNPDDLFFLIAIIFASLIAFTRNFEPKLLLPFLYPASGVLFFLVIYQDYGIDAMIWLLVVVAMTDVGAFFTGKAIGSHQFCTTSPNKTWEGVIGGILVATISGTYAGSFVTPWKIALIVSFVTAVASIYGDLFESFLKRRAGVKDSGNILPGHGGVLDRIDGYLFGAIIMVIALRAIL